ncbi:MAG: isocitrate lyase/phosphoenolpyruvate mutase family protein, partial [Planctomycetota bacterium]
SPTPPTSPTPPSHADFFADAPLSPGTRLRTAMDKGCVAAPGAFNALAARAIAKAGFEACYVSGAATSVCAGVPDVGLLTLEHFCRVIREVADASGLPVLADADTGFGEAEMVRRTVIDYAKAGAAGLHLEDQKFPKRCGHLDGKELVSLDHMIEKIMWADKARASIEGFVICARTDARGVEGFDAALARAKAYALMGADMIFPEGLTSETEFAKFAHELRNALPEDKHPYLLANMTEFGKTPIIPLSKFQEMGYSIVIFPVSLLRVAMGAVTRALEQLKATGSVEPFLGEMQTRKDLYDLIGYTPGTPWELPR